MSSHQEQIVDPYLQGNFESTMIWNLIKSLAEVQQNCSSTPKTCQHFLVEFEALQVERRKYLQQTNAIPDRLATNRLCSDTVTHHSAFTESFPDVTRLEVYSRELIDTLHRKSIKLLALSERQHGLANSNLSRTYTPVGRASDSMMGPT